MYLLAHNDLQNMFTTHLPIDCKVCFNNLPDVLEEGSDAVVAGLLVWGVFVGVSEFWKVFYSFNLF